MKICTNCKEQFTSEYLTCVYCWYDKVYSKTLVHGYKYLPKEKKIEE